MSVLKVTKDNFNEVKNSDKTVLLDFYADWCGPCRMVSPIIDEIAEEIRQDQAESFEYLGRGGWDEDWESEEAKDDYYADCYAVWVEMTKEEFYKECNE